MTAAQLEKNLLIFLDRHGETGGDSWRFIDWRELSVRREAFAVQRASHGQAVISFDRRSYLDYLLFPWLARLLPGLEVKRKVLHVKDGLLSCFFDANNAACYGAYAANHLPRPSTLRQKLVSWLPLSLRAEERFIVTGTTRCEAGTPCHSHNQRHSHNQLLQKQDLMFYSNAAGKLVLAAGETCRSGKGVILKTTANAAYRKVMEKEFLTMKRVAATRGSAACLPAVGECITSGNRVYFTEEYVKGRSLLEVLRHLSATSDADGVCRLLDRLDAWFEEYLTCFTGSIDLASSYRHLLASFSELYGGDVEGVAALASAGRAVKEVSGEGVKVAAITCHNDLWPGNFVVREDALVAVDWERASENGAPVYDYYWMMISAALVYVAGLAGSTRFSDTFPRFCARQDAVSRYATERLESFLERRGFDTKLHRNFMFLFLMELSVQGYLALGCQSELDRMAYQQLLALSREDAAVR